jgi:hypothetical protein
MEAMLPLQDASQSPDPSILRSSDPPTTKGAQGTKETRETQEVVIMPKFNKNKKAPSHRANWLCLPYPDVSLEL